MTIRKPQDAGRRHSAETSHRDPSSSGTLKPPSAKHRLHGRSVSPFVFVQVDDPPGPNDVICGRDLAARSQNHAGNRAFRRIIQEFRGPYRGAATRKEKGVILKAVALTVRQRGGRFVAPCEGSGAWREVEAEVALEKIREALHRRFVSALAWLPAADAPPPAQEEDAAYHDLLAAQRALFSSLLDQEECSRK